MKRAALVAGIALALLGAALLLVAATLGATTNKCGPGDEGYEAFGACPTVTAPWRPHAVGGGLALALAGGWLVTWAATRR